MGAVLVLRYLYLGLLGIVLALALGLIGFWARCISGEDDTQVIAVDTSLM